MLSPEWYNACAEYIAALYQRLEDDILRDIIRRFLKTGIITDSAKWQAEVLQEAGMLRSDIIRSIAQHSQTAYEEIRMLFESAGVETVSADNAITEETPDTSPVMLSDSMKQILDASYKATMGNIENLTSTTAITSQRTYIAACNRMYMQVSSGAFSYQTALRQALKDFSNGVFVQYPTGHRDRIDVAIARAVRTGIGQASAEIGIENAKELNTDLMEIDAHSGARPSHAWWQGKLVSLSGINAGRIVDGIKVLSLSDIGYGTGAGFRGWNCRHDWNAYIEGVSTPNYTQEQLDELDKPCIEWNGKMYTRYEISQMQRYRERKIRALKRELVCYDAAGDKEAFNACSVKLKANEQKLKDFCKATGTDRENWREQVKGFGRSQSSKAVWANKEMNIRNEIKSKYGSIAEKSLTLKEQRDIIKNKEKLSNADVRKWYLEHDKKIPNMINTDLPIEAQARQAFELRNSFRTIARDMMQDVEARAKLDMEDPNKTFDELVESKMNRKGLSREKAIEDILKTATKTRASVNKKFGLE